MEAGDPEPVTYLNTEISNQLLGFVKNTGGMVWLQGAVDTRCWHRDPSVPRPFQGKDGAWYILKYLFVVGQTATDRMTDLCRASLSYRTKLA
jgi:hypothetical protein